MNTRKLLLSVLLVATICFQVRAADSPAYSEEQAYRDYLKSNQEMNDAYQRDSRVTAVILLVVVVGLFTLLTTPLARRSRRAFELAERQQKTLEEIRDLLKKE